MGDMRQVQRPVADILRRPQGPRERQLLWGEVVELGPAETGTAEAGYLPVVAARDGYRGWMREADLGPLQAASHRVTAPASHIYSAPDLKSPERGWLSFGSRLDLGGEENGFAEIRGAGWVPLPHVAPLAQMAPDPVAVAELFLGTPYLWGGNSRAGIDCSGLVQAACLACGLSCPGDSGDQEAALGTELAPDAPLQRGDLLFWKGHVAWVSDPVTILHANAGYMATVYEPLEAAIARILAQGDGPVTARKRIAPR